jgi:hypothetical protein
VSDKPLDLDKHRGMAAQKATDIRRILADVENNAKNLRDRQAILENQLLSVPAAKSAASRQSRGVAPARCRIGLVQHKSERNICFGAA